MLDFDIHIIILRSIFKRIYVEFWLLLIRFVIKTTEAKLYTILIGLMDLEDIHKTLIYSLFTFKHFLPKRF